MSQARMLRLFLHWSLKIYETGKETVTVELDVEFEELATWSHVADGCNCNFLNTYVKGSLSEIEESYQT